MDPALQRLVDAVIAGNDESVEQLAATLRREEFRGAPLDDLARHAHPRVRRAVIDALAGRTDGAAERHVRAGIADEEDEVRTAAARTLVAHPPWCADEDVRALSLDGEWSVRQLAAKAARGRPALLDRVYALCSDDDEDVRLAALQGLAHEPFARCAAALLARTADEHTKPRRAAQQALEKRLERDAAPSGLADVTPEVLEKAHLALKSAAATFPRSAAWVAALASTVVDATALAGFGVDLSAEARRGELPRGHEVADHVAHLREVLARPGARSAVLLGPAGSGKTAIANELAHALMAEGCFLLRLSPADLLVGTKYIGEWQTRLSDLVRHARRPKRVVIVVPNVHELVDVGRATESLESAATMLLPQLENGSIALVGESTPEAFALAVQRVPSLGRVLEVVRVEPADAARTQRILERIASDAGAVVPRETLARLSEIAELMLSGAAQPARSAGLLRTVLDRAAKLAPGVPPRFTPRDVLAAVSTTTGVPIELLDDDAPLDLSRVRAFFESRVMGQPEAVDAVVELVTLVKAGLNDPRKPAGVFLFVGPTGVGKTELSRALAEYLFGDANRLVRIDLSEYATEHAHERLLGGRGRSGALTGPIRERPFSVVLLDEVEKANQNVFDVCLQLFDAGRLTDAAGSTVDFTRSIVILTSNVGSAVPTETRLGFGRERPAAPDAEAVDRALRQFFRPEFLNRIDRVVHFRPLALETAERIAERELSRVLDRSGIERRNLTIAPGAGVVALLLARGYSPAFGARPLKRTVERLVLLPLARALAVGDIQNGSFVALIARGDHIEIEVEAPEDELAVGETPRASRSLEEVRARAARLAESADARAADLEPLRGRRSELVATTSEPGFWDDREKALAALDDVHRVEAVLERATAHDAAARTLAEHALREREPREAGRLAERLRALEAEGDRADLLATRGLAGELADAALTVSLVRRTGTAFPAVEPVARMYAAWAERLGLEVEVLDDRRDDGASEDVVAFAIRGAGAHALLAHEDGDHRFLDKTLGDREGRAVVRVEVLRLPSAEGGLDRARVRVEKRNLGGVGAGRFLLAPRHELRFVLEPGHAALRVWSESDSEAEILRRLPLLAARRAATIRHSAVPTVVRRYVLGASPVVRDRRTGVSTGRVAQVLAGDLDLLRAPTA
ncbi:MAG: AAA family ATPase [Planctomycetota bacterium]|nr:AAA family ATPase [Planctomycetota bacterium]